MVRAFGLHPKGRGFESLSGHRKYTAMLENKYSKPGADYIASRILKGITGIFYSYPEFMFLLKVFIALAALGIAIFILKGVFT